MPIPSIIASAILQWSRNFRAAESSSSSAPAARPSTFNGAATLGLRKVCMYGQKDACSKILQWSRNFRAAESAMNATDWAASAPLQWSRNFRAAERGRGGRVGAALADPSMEPQL